MGGLFSRSTNENSTPSNEFKRTTCMRQQNGSNGYTWSEFDHQRHLHFDYDARRSLSPRQQEPTEFRTYWRNTRNVRRTNYDQDYFPGCEKIPYSLSPAYRILEISSSDPEYYEVKRRITNKHFIVDNIEKIKNKFLENSYLLKKQQKLKSFPDLEELELFHGTKWVNVDSICTNNFNWRFHGKGTGERFGRGVSFSCNAMYASNYSHDQKNKVMFIAKVLIGAKCLGNSSMILPEEDHDTSTKQNDNIVIVKYEDNDFYPIYRIRYHISPNYVRQKHINQKYKVFVE